MQTANMKKMKMAHDCSAWLVILLLALFACNGEGSGPPLASVVPPFPNDIFTTDAQTTTGLAIDLTVSSPLLDPMLEFGLWKRDQLVRWLGRHDGFSTFGPIYLLVGAQADPATLPYGLASTGPRSSVFLVDLGAGSPTHGQRVPIAVGTGEEDDDELGLLHLLRLAPLVPLRPSTRYGLVVRKKVRDVNGRPLPESGFYRVLRGESELDTSAPLAGRMERARGQAVALFTYLDQVGIARDEVAEATVFTTQSATELMDAVRAYLHGASAPPLNLKWTASYPPDQLPDLPDGVGDLSSIATVVKGTFDVPDLRGPDGDVTTPPASTRVVQVPFIIALPAAAQKKACPVVMMQHGHGGRKELALFVAPALAERGMATAAIDHVQHGELGSGGIFIDIVSVPRLQGNFAQTIANGLRLIQVLRATTTVPVGGETYSLTTSAGVGYIGESLGGISGGTLAGVEPDVTPVVLNVAGGGVAISLAGDSIGSLVKNHELLGLGLVTLMQTMVDPIDPVSFASRLWREPGPGGKKQLLMQNVVGDSIGTKTAASLAEAIGATYVCPCANKDVELLGLSRRDAPAPPPGLFYFGRGKHGFLLTESSDPVASEAVRRQAATFFETYYASGSGLIIDPLPWVAESQPQGWTAVSLP